MRRNAQPAACLATCLAISLAIIATAGLPSVANGAETLGRLFFTPERRAALERQRQHDIQESETVHGESASLDGIVKRNSGRSTIWVNGRAQHDNGNATGVGAELDKSDPAKAVIAIGAEPPVALRVGESANRATGERKDGLAGGSIVIKRDPLRP
jgi:hypothetical protein